MAAGLAGAIVVTSTSERLYEGTTRVFIGIQGDAGVAEDLQAVQLTGQLLQSFARIGTSRGQAERIIEEVGASTSPEDLRTRLSAEVEPETVLIRLGVRDPNRTMARRLAAASADTLEAAIEDLDTTSASVDVRVVDEATVEGPVSPRPVLNTVIGLGIGLLVGLAIALVLEGLRPEPA
jgi:capsular polysaccharide biosynthesis protein